VNSYYQLRDVESLNAGRRLLVIGPGQGLDTQIFRWRGYEVVTFDIDETFSPDIVGSVHDLSMFPADRFDVAIASHVVEHVAEPYLDAALCEIARVASHAVIYLPIGGRHFHLRCAPGITPLDVSLIVDMINPFNRPDGITPKYEAGQHFWEVGRPGWSLRAVRKRLTRYFDILRSYRNRDWLGSQNFVLRSKR
jgi:SAM-dependent methyltransferase